MRAKGLQMQPNYYMSHLTDIIVYHLFCVLRMDVHRSIGAVTPESLAEGSSMAAEALHKSLVAMRKELAKKNKVRNHGHHQLSLLYPD